MDTQGRWRYTGRASAPWYDINADPSIVQPLAPPSAPGFEDAEVRASPRCWCATNALEHMSCTLLTSQNPLMADILFGRSALPHGPMHLADCSLDRLKGAECQSAKFYSEVCVLQALSSDSDEESAGAELRSAAAAYAATSKR